MFTYNFFFAKYRFAQMLRFYLRNAQVECFYFWVFSTDFGKSSMEFVVLNKFM